MIRCVVYLLLIFKMFHGLMNNPVYFRYTTYLFYISSKSDESKKLPDDGRLLPKHVGACMMNKGLVQFSA
jgi:hypothetical protein